MKMKGRRVTVKCADNMSWTAMWSHSSDMRFLLTCCNQVRMETGSRLSGNQKNPFHVVTVTSGRAGIAQ
jgi:hypothetical protein